MPNPGNRIAVFLATLHGGGAERMMLNLAHEFSQQGLNVDLIIASAEGPYLKHMPPDVRVIDLKAQRVISSLPGLVRYLRQERPVSLLSTMGHVNLVALWARRVSGVPTRIIVRAANTTSHSTQNSEYKRGRLVPLLMRFLYPWADGIVAISNGVADDLAKVAHLPREIIDVIYNPAVTPEMLLLAQEPIDHPWFTPGEPPVVLGAGRLTKQKDFPTLIRAFALVRQAMRARLVILGEGKDRPQLEALVRELGIGDDVAMPGFVDNPHTYMAHASIFVFSSAWEGFGNVLVEAMAVGTPVVSTDCESGPAEILQGGTYGMLTPVGDVKALAESILYTLSIPTNTAMLQMRADEFSIDKISRQYLEVLNGMRRPLINLVDTEAGY